MEAEVKGWKWNGGGGSERAEVEGRGRRDEGGRRMEGGRREEEGGRVRRNREGGMDVEGDGI